MQESSDTAKMNHQVCLFFFIKKNINLYQLFKFMVSLRIQRHLCNLFKLKIEINYTGG